MNFLGIGNIVKSVFDGVDELVTSDEERAKADLELKRLGLEEKKIEAGLLKGQMEINKEEAKHKSFFVAGWRPAIGWVGASSLAYQFLIYPFLVWGWSLLQARSIVPTEMNPPPMLDTDALWVLLSGMLGIAGMRSFDKVKGKVTNRLKG